MIAPTDELPEAGMGTYSRDAYGFEGPVNEMRLFDYALNQDEIERLFMDK